MYKLLFFLQGIATNESGKSGLLDGFLKTIFPMLFGRDDPNWLMPSIFIGIISVVFFGFLYYARRKRKKFKADIDLLNKEFSKVSRDSIHANFEELKYNILNTKRFDSIWREFEKTLIKINESDGTKVYSTTDAGRYFNEHTLIRSHINLRFLNAGAGILVTLGLMGTFIGISAGLGEISLAGNNSAELTEGITSLLAGAQVAFSSSVWGLSLSLYLNVFEKIRVRSLSNEVTELQQVIDSVFERKTIEEILSHTLHEEKQQTQQLQVFNDDLVMRLGEVLDKSIQDNLNPVFDILLEAVQELTDFKKESATETIQKLIEEFKTSMTAGANDQLQELSGTLKQTADLLNKANDKTAQDQQQMQVLLSNHLNEFEGKAQNIMSDVVRSQKEMNDQQREALNEVLQSLQNGVDKTDQHFKTLLESTETSVNSNLLEIKEMFSNLSEDYEQNLKDLKDHFTSEKETMGEMVEKINGQLKAFDHSISAMNTTSVKIKEVAPVLESATSNLKESTNRFRESQKEFLDVISDYVNQTKNITSGNKELINEIKNSLEETRSHWSAYEDKFSGLRDDLNSIFNELNVGLSTYNERTRTGLNGNLTEFDSIMGKSIATLSTGVDQLKEILEGIEERTVISKS